MRFGAVAAVRTVSAGSVTVIIAGGEVAPLIPLWVKVVYTVFVCVVVWVYAREYGPGNFLWFSDMALLVTVVALWMESALLASMMAVGALVPELAWNVGFAMRLIGGKDLTQLT